MGGQACVLYGAAEFSRDTDLAILADSANLARLQAALDELQASCVAVPPFELAYLEMGLAVHFRCKHPHAPNMRIDIMSNMRGVDTFEQLWKRRTTIEYKQLTIDLLSLPDLIQAKKTQRDKDWPMVTRLLESHYFAHRDSPHHEQIEFWLREMRTPVLLIEVAQHHPAECSHLVPQRPLLQLAKKRNEAELRNALHDEELRQRECDRQYWQPLKQTLEQLRLDRRSGQPREK